MSHDSCEQSDCVVVRNQGSGLDEAGFNRSYNNWNTAWGFKSQHPGGAQFLFGDGSVHMLSQDINIKAYNLLGCHNDERVIPKY